VAPRRLVACATASGSSKNTDFRAAASAGGRAGGGTRSPDTRITDSAVRSVCWLYVLWLAPAGVGCSGAVRAPLRPDGGLTCNAVCGVGEQIGSRPGTSGYPPTMKPPREWGTSSAPGEIRTPDLRFRSSADGADLGAIGAGGHPASADFVETGSFSRNASATSAASSSRGA
jgi:hypothetical protein